MTSPLDPRFDPDRYDPARDDLPPDPVVQDGPLDMSLDPDRYRPEAGAPRQPPALGRTGGTRQTLPDLLGDGAFEDKTSPYVFLLGLLGVAVFLGIVAFVFAHLSPS